MDESLVKIQFIKQCGHHKRDTIEAVSIRAAAQYIAAGFAIEYVESDAIAKNNVVEQPAPEAIQEDVIVTEKQPAEKVEKPKRASVKKAKE